MTARLDHLVVAAATLDEGRSWVEDQLGVPMEDGGRHTEFGTHNALLRLGAQSYLEVIAVDPDAPAPDRPRWFELDTPAMVERLARGPALVHWVVAVPGGALPQADPDLGLPTGLSRGQNRWTLTIRDDGALPMGGVLPSLIVWHTPPPYGVLPDRGVDLQLLVLGSPEAGRVSERVAALGLTDPPVVGTADSPSLTAALRTPTGFVTI